MKETRAGRGFDFGASETLLEILAEPTEEERRDLRHLAVGENGGAYYCDGRGEVRVDKFFARISLVVLGGKPYEYAEALEFDILEGAPYRMVENCRPVGLCGWASEKDWTRMTFQEMREALREKNVEEAALLTVTEENWKEVFRGSKLVQKSLHDCCGYMMVRFSTFTWSKKDCKLPEPSPERFQSFMGAEAVSVRYSFVDYYGTPDPEAATVEFGRSPEGPWLRYTRPSMDEDTRTLLTKRGEAWFLRRLENVDLDRREERTLIHMRAEFTLEAVFPDGRTMSVQRDYWPADWGWGDVEFKYLAWRTVRL